MNNISETGYQPASVTPCADTAPATVLTTSPAEHFNPMSLMPQRFGDKFSMAKVLCASGMIPAGLNTPEKVCVALEWGHELQLSPMVAVNNIAVVNGRPTLSADIMHAIARRSPEYGGLKWLRQDAEAAECVITRRTDTYSEEVRGYYDMKMAVAAGLASKDNWKKYPARMLKHRALSYALRDAFPDVLAGIYNPDEMENVIPNNTVRDVTNSAETTATVPPINAEHYDWVPQTESPGPDNGGYKTAAATPDDTFVDDIPYEKAPDSKDRQAMLEELASLFKTGLFSEEEIMRCRREAAINSIPTDTLSWARTQFEARRNKQSPELF